MKEVMKGFSDKMKYSSGLLVMLSLLGLTLHSSISVVLTSPVESPSSCGGITDEIVHTPVSSLKKFFTWGSYEAEFCRIPNNCATEPTDSRSVLCCGFLDLKYENCSKVRPLNEILDQSSERVPVFCKRWMRCVSSNTLWDQYSFKYITEFCESVCASRSLTTRKVEVHKMCSLLYRIIENIIRCPSQLPSKPKAEINPAKALVDKQGAPDEKDDPKYKSRPPLGEALNHISSISENLEAVGNNAPEPIDTDESRNAGKVPQEIVSKNGKLNETNRNSNEPIANKLENNASTEASDASNQQLVVVEDSVTQIKEIEKDKTTALQSDPPIGEASKPKDEKQNTDNNLLNNHSKSSKSEPLQLPPSPNENSKDSEFFQYFMVVCAAFILGYVALVNKKKLIALIVEGRPDRSRRGNQYTAVYSKLDSNLEEALSSNRTAVSSHQVLY